MTFIRKRKTDDNKTGQQPLEEEQKKIQHKKNQTERQLQIFVVGDQLQIVPRTSISNVDMAHLHTTDNYLFNSQGINKNFGADNPPSLSSHHESTTIPLLAKYIRRHSRLSLFGFDVICHNRNGASEEEVLSVIDVNFFPGYIGMDNFPSSLLSLCHELKVGK